MEKFKTQIKKRGTYKIISGIVLLPLAIVALILYINTDHLLVDATPVNDFISGFFNGSRGAIVLGFAAFQIITGISDLKATKNEAKLKELQVTENDERINAIAQISSKVAYNISLFALMIACLIFGICNQVLVSVTLLITWVVIVLIRIFTFAYYNKKM